MESSFWLDKAYLEEEAKVWIFSCLHFDQLEKHEKKEKLGIAILKEIEGICH